MQRVGMVVKREERALILGDEIIEFLRRAGKDVLLEQDMGELATRWGGRVTSKLTDESDLLVVLGGDGTILKAASLLNDKPIPVLGINLGRVGFMAEIHPEEAIRHLSAIFEGRSEYVNRMMLSVTMPNGRICRVLNDMVIHWSGIARLIDLGIRVANSREIELRSDGLIVSTPIGSSAYSYAAHGPLVHPEVEGILLTPICPYAGLKRPLLIPAHFEFILVLKKGGDLTLTLDGHTSMAMVQGEAIKISRAPIPFIMVKSPTKDYFDVLKQKLNLI